MSNWLDPDWARAAIATASPATGTAAAVEAPPGDADAVAVAAKAVKPRFGRPLASVFTPAAPPWVFDVPAASAEVAETSAVRALT
jgi:hypothetical protein